MVKIVGKAWDESDKKHTRTVEVGRGTAEWAEMNRICKGSIWENQRNKSSAPRKVSKRCQYGKMDIEYSEREAS
jgi:hypothetical protein